MSGVRQVMDDAAHRLGVDGFNQLANALDDASTTVADLIVELVKLRQFAFVDRWGAKGFDDDAMALRDSSAIVLARATGGGK